METKGNILIVDDDPSIRKVLAAILVEKGYTVETVDTGKKGISRSKNRFYNLALIDIRLPDMEGTQLLRQMRQTEPKMARVIITGYPSLQNAVEALNNGADAYIIKPLDIDHALTVIENLLQKQRESLKMTQEKIVEYIETRAKEIEKEGYASAR